MSNPKVIFEIEKLGSFTAELFPEVAPISVENFLKLVNQGYYDGLTFHRIIKGFMIQGGCPNGDGTGDPGYTIKGEFNKNGVKNDIIHKKGVLSMARTMQPDSAGSQFFVVTAESNHLDGMYAAFGEVIEGLHVVDAIENAPTGRTEMQMGKSRYEIRDSEGNLIEIDQFNADMPIDKVVMKSVKEITK